MKTRDFIQVGYQPWSPHANVVDVEEWCSDEFPLAGIYQIDKTYIFFILSKDLHQPESAHYKRWQYSVIPERLYSHIGFSSFETTDDMWLWLDTHVFSDTQDIITVLSDMDHSIVEIES